MSNSEDKTAGDESNPAPFTLPESGAIFKVPVGWRVDALDAGCAMSTADGALRVTAVDVGAAADAHAAMTMLCAIADVAPPAPRAATPVVIGEGWDEVHHALAINAESVTVLLAFRHAETWVGIAIDGPMAALERYGADLALIQQSLRPAGFARWSASGRPAAPLTADMLSGFTDFLTDGMAELGIPGIGYALCSRDGRIFDGGLGMTAAHSGDAVDAHTLFQIASNTKGLTTLLLSALVAQGALGWDMRVVDVYPDFRLGDAALTARLRVCDLVSAATGLPRQDIVWAMTNRPDTPAARIFALLSDARPTSAFGETFQYNNLMAAAAGFIAGHVAFPDMEPGAAFDRAMQTFIFDPLAMQDTTFDFARAYARPHALGHGLDHRGTLVASDPAMHLASIASRPSGGAWSTGHDMIRYVVNELRDPAEAVGGAMRDARRQPGVSTGEHGAYGMGLMIDRSFGVDIIHHGGSTPGFMSDIVILPDAGIGAVVLTNADAGMHLLPLVRRRLVELVYGAPPVARDQLARQGARIAAEQAHFDATVRSILSPSTLANLARHYHSPELGTLAIRAHGDTTLFDFGLWSSRMGERMAADGSIELVTIAPGMRGIVFTPDADGIVIREAQHAYRYSPDPVKH